MTEEHESLRQALGVYVLGALQPDERRRVDAHVAGCRSCRRELSELAGLPGLLHRLSADEATQELLQVPDGFAGRLLAARARQRRRERRSLATWRAIAAAAVLVAVTLAAPWGGASSTVAEPPAEQIDLQPASAQVAANGAATMRGVTWGTILTLDVTGLPPGDGYVLWAVDRHGHAEQAANWGPTPTGRARVTGASAIARADLARIVISARNGVPLLARDAI